MATDDSQNSERLVSNLDGEHGDEAAAAVEDQLAKDPPVRQEVEQYLTSDADLSPVAAKLEVQELKLKFIEDVIKSINGRGYLIKSAVEWLRFSQGS